MAAVRLLEPAPIARVTSPASFALPLVLCIGEMCAASQGRGGRFALVIALPLDRCQTASGQNFAHIGFDAVARRRCSAATGHRRAQ